MRMRMVGPVESPMLVAIHRQCFPNYWDVDAFNDFFAIPGTFATVAEIGDDTVAMCVHRVQHEQADIITLAVLPGWRRRGLGRILLENAMKHALSMGADRMFLDVEDGNGAAKALYEAHGFSVINRRVHYYRQKDGSYTDALVMNCKLA